MSPFDRRMFMFSMASIAAFMSFGRKSMFKAEFSMDISGFMNRREAEKSRKRVEDVQGIKNLNEEFKAEGKLISIDYHHSESELVWSYIFIDKEAFLAWEAEIELRELIKRDLLLTPNKAKYSYVLS